MSIAFSFAPSPDTVQDIIQDAFIEFVREADPEAEQAELLRTLRRVTRRVAQRLWDDRYRNSPEKLQRIGRRLIQLASRHFEDRRFDDEMIALHSCMAKLPEKSRKLVEDHYFMENSVAAISRRFEVTPRSVFKALHTIRLKLQDCIRTLLQKENRHA